MSTNNEPRRIGEILAELGYCNGSGPSSAKCGERIVVLGYRVPVWVTVDLAVRGVTRVEVGDGEVAPIRDGRGMVAVTEVGDGVSPGEEADAAQIAEASVWPAWRLGR